LSTHSDSEFFDAIADQLAKGRLDSNQIEQIDDLLSGYSVAVRMYLEQHGRQKQSQEVELREAA